MNLTILASSSAGNAYAVTDGETTLLLEAGIRMADLRRGLGFGVSQLAGCLISHEHADHSKAAAEVMKAGVDVYASAGTIVSLDLTGHRVHPVQARQQFRIGAWTILPFEAVHDAQEPLGFLLASGAEKLLYLTDSAYCLYRFTGLTVLLVECNHSREILRHNVEAGVISAEHRRRVLRNHMSLERLLEFLAANDLSQVREIHLLHLSRDNSNAAEFKAAVQRASGKPVYIADA